MRTNSDVGPDGQARQWPTPIRDRQWVDEQGTVWRMRGPEIRRRELTRLLKRDDVRLLHVYGLDPTVIPKSDTGPLVTRVEEFFAGDAPPMSDFVLGDFRDDQRRVMIVVQESC